LGRRHNFTQIFSSVLAGAGLLGGGLLGGLLEHERDEYRERELDEREREEREREREEREREREDDRGYGDLQHCFNVFSFTHVYVFLYRRRRLWKR
jgi:hypothetical protein